MDCFGINSRFRLDYIMIACVSVSTVFLPKSVFSNTLSADDIHRLREQAKLNIASSTISALYAHVLNFMTVPGISTSRVKVGDGGANLQLFKLPFQIESNHKRPGSTELYRVNISNASFNAPKVDESNGATSVGRATSASVGTGLRVQMSKRMTSITAVDFGVSQFSDSTVYYTQDSIEHTAPVLDGIFFNWQTNAWNLGLTLGLDYNINYGGSNKLEVVGVFNYNYISSFNESKDFAKFDNNASTVSIHGNFDHPLGISLSKKPLFGIFHLGATSFVGSDSDILGFSSYAQFGYTLRMEYGHRKNATQDFQLGFQLLRGDNVTGYSILFDLNY